MIQALFGVLLGGGLLFGLVKGQGDAALTVLLGAAREGVETAFSLAGSFALFCGMMGILRASGAADALARKAEKPLQRLLGRGANPDALPYVAFWAWATRPRPWAWRPPGGWGAATGQTMPCACSW